MNRPERSNLPHDIPFWLDPANAIYFVTLCCKNRGHNHLCHSELAAKIFETVAFRNTRQTWYMHLFLLMPDHLHALVSIPRSGVDGAYSNGLKSIVSEWKRWTARSLEIPWQRDFFEHRLRRDESFIQKSDYIRHNPVRANLAAVAEEWPYVWMPGRSC